MVSNRQPRRKIYFDQSFGVAVQDVWMEYRDAHNQNIKITGYPTEKNPDLLKRIIEASSNLGDLVLDCFAGSGTTLDVATKLGRNWIGVDNSTEAIVTILDRFANGLAPMGDFVNKSTPNHIQSQLKLFESSATESAPETFSLLAVEPYDNSLDKLLKISINGSGE